MFTFNVITSSQVKHTKHKTLTVTVFCSKVLELEGSKDEFRELKHWLQKYVYTDLRPEVFCYAVRVQLLLTENCKLGVESSVTMILWQKCNFKLVKEIINVIQIFCSCQIRSFVLNRNSKITPSTVFYLLPITIKIRSQSVKIKIMFA